MTAVDAPLDAPLPPAIVEAAQKLPGQDVRVLVVLYPELRPDVYRPVKLDWLAHVLRMHRGNVVRSLRRLARHGYIERGPRDGRIATYRVTAA